MSTTQVRRNGAYAPLGANYADDDAIATLDLEENDRAELLYLRGLAYCARDPRTEGYISDIALRTGKVLRRERVKKRTKNGTTVHDSVQECAAVLAELGLWTREGDGYRITNWLKWNKSWHEISRSRAQDRARKGGNDTDDDGNDTGGPSDSERNPTGLLAPRQGIARQGSTGHGKTEQRSTPSAANGDGTRSSSTEKQLLDKHQAQFGQLPAVSIDGLAKVIGRALTDGHSDTEILAGLETWHGRPRVGPGLLKNLIADAAKTPPDPMQLDPDAAAYIEELKAARAGAAR